MSRRALAFSVPKFTCPGCGDSQWRTTNSRFDHDVDAVVRRRVCKTCGFRLTTDETIRRSKENLPNYNI